MLTPLCSTLNNTCNIGPPPGRDSCFRPCAMQSKFNYVWYLGTGCAKVKRCSYSLAVPPACTWRVVFWSQTRRPHPPQQAPSRRTCVVQTWVHVDVHARPARPHLHPGARLLPPRWPLVEPDAQRQGSLEPHQCRNGCAGHREREELEWMGAWSFLMTAF